MPVATDAGARFDTVALSGGCFQNRILFEEIGRGVSSRTTSPCSRMLQSRPTTAAWRSARRRSAPRAYSTTKDKVELKESAMCLGIPGRISAIDDVARKLATVDVSGVRRQINIACIVDDEHPVDVCVGDWVLVHVGFAMSRIDEAEAAETLQILTELGEAQAELEAMRLSATTTTGAAA